MNDTSAYVMTYDGVVTPVPFGQVPVCADGKKILPGQDALTITFSAAARAGEIPFGWPAYCPVAFAGSAQIANRGSLLGLSKSMIVFDIRWSSRVLKLTAQGLS